MNLSRSLVDSWYNREPFLSDVGSSSTKPTDGHIVFRNKTYPSATAALEAYIDDYLGHNTRERRRYGRDSVADLLLMTPVGDTSSLPSVSMMSSSESQDRGGNGCSGIKMPENFATDSESSNPKTKHHHVVGTSVYESTRDLDRILAESRSSQEGKTDHSWTTAHTPADHSHSTPVFTRSPTHKPTSPPKSAVLTHADLEKIRSRACDNASYRSFLEQSHVHTRSVLSRSLDSLLSNRNDSDSTAQDSDDKYSSDGGRCPPSWIQDVDREEDVDGAIVSGHMIHRRSVPRDKSFGIAVSTPKHLARSYSPGRCGNDSTLSIHQVEPPRRQVSGSSSNMSSAKLRHMHLQSTESPDTFHRRDGGVDSRLDQTVDSGTLHDTYFDSKSASWSRMSDFSQLKTPTLREKPTDLSRSLNDLQTSPERRRTPRPKRDGSPGKTVCFDFTPQEPSRKLPPVYDLMAPWLKDSQREAYLRRLESEIEDSPSSVAGDSVCSSSNWKACDILGTSLGICADSAGDGTGGGKHVPVEPPQVQGFTCAAQPEVGTFLEKIRHLLATPPPHEPRGTVSAPDTPTSEQILDGDRSWEKTSSKATPDYLREVTDLTGTMDVDRIVAALLTSTGSAPQSGDMSQRDSLRPGTKEALKNILFAMQTTMGTIPPKTATTAVTPPSPTSSQKHASMAVQTEQHSLERVKNLSVSITPESRQLLAARASQEAGGESLERALLHLARLKELVENTKECLH